MSILRKKKSFVKLNIGFKKIKIRIRSTFLFASFEIAPVQMIWVEIHKIS
jgi:hypothetical protein